MDMDFKGQNSKGPKPTYKQPNSDEKALPGFRPASELPQGSIVPVRSSVQSNSTPTNSGQTDDPTDLTLDRAKDFPDLNLEDSTKEEPKKLKVKKKMTKKQLLVMLSLLLLVAGGAVGYLWWQKRAETDTSAGSTTTTSSEQKKEVAPTTAPAPITGIETNIEASKRPVTAVMIENSIDARPQSGLSDADMVVEAVAEGGITRFVALYQQGAPSSLGPIRSARPYYVEIAKTFDAAFVHAGGSPDALALIPELKIKDMSAFENNDTYVRLTSRAAPHNLYSSMTKLDQRRTALGFTTSTYNTWKHKEDTAQTPSASTIKFSLSGQLYDVQFNYDATSNSYKRSVGGEPQLDANNNKQLQPKVVIALLTTKGQNGQYSTYRLNGSGEIMVFQDGIISSGTWTKDSSSAQFVFKDKNGLDFVFNKGQIWMTLLGGTADVTTQP